MAKKEVKLKKFCLLNKEGNVIFSSDKDFKISELNNDLIQILDPDNYKLKNVIKISDGSKGTAVKCTEVSILFDNLILGKKADKKTGTKYLIADKRGTTLGEYSDVGNSQENRMGVSNKDNKWGFIDETGKLVIDFIYDNVGSFQNNLARVELDGKYGVININGEIIVPIKYDNVDYGFEDGLIKVKLDGKYGFIDKKGEVKIPIIYEKADSFSEKLANVEYKGKYGYIDTDGHFKIDPIFTTTYPFKNGFAKVRTDTENDAKFKFGLIDKTGKFVIKPEFYAIIDCFKDSYISEDGERWAAQLLTIIQDEDYKQGLVNKEGKVVAECKYHDFFFCANGYWIARLGGGKIGLLNPEGKIIIEPIFKNVEELYVNLDNQAFIVTENENKKKGLVNLKGELIVPIEFDEIEYICDEIVAVKNKALNGLYSLKGDKLFDPIFSDIRKIGEKLIVLKHEDKEWLADKTGNIISKDYYDIEKFSDGLVRFSLDGKRGYLDEEGKIAIQPKFYYAKDFKDGNAIVEESEDKYGLIDKEGNYIIEPKYEYLNYIGDDPISKNKLVFETNDGKWGILSDKGEILTKELFDHISTTGRFSDSDKLTFKKNGKLGLINLNGEIVVEPIYDEVMILKQNMAAVCQKGEWGIVNEKGELVVKPQFKDVCKYGFQDGVCKVETFN